MANNEAKHIMILTGEASADEHAAQLVLSLKKYNPKLIFSGMGSKKMAQAGVDLLVDSSKMAIIGLVELLQIWRQVHHALKIIKAALRKQPPDLLILIDYAGFNLKIAKYAKKLGIKTLYYIGPQVWASRAGRIKKLKQRVDMMAVIFPFESQLYRQADVPVRFVGHPLSHKVKTSRPIAESLEQFGFNNNHPIIGLIPGSRRGEIQRLLPCILETAAILKKKHPTVQFILPLAPNLSTKDLTPYLQQYDLEIKLVENDTYNVIACCDTVICVSGTVTLEIALLEKPMVIIYRIANLTYFIARMIVNIRQIGLCNIIAEQPIVKEFIQFDMQPDSIATEVEHILQDTNYRQQMISQLAIVKQKLTDIPADQSIDQLVLELLN